MELFSRHWLIVAHIKEIGFYDIAQQYSIITTKKAYGMFNDKNYQSALNTFYSEIRQINDLEAIYNFVTIGYVYDTKLKQQVKKSLTLLQKGHILKENSEFAKALILLIKEKETKENLEKAKTILQHMQAMGLTPAMKNLLLGYVYHRLLELSHKDNGEYDVTLYKKAHYQYMLALDLAYDNQRIQSAVLENLGMLHFSVGNYALSTHFFAQRSTLPFLNIQSEASFRWHFARALFYYNHYKQAKEEGDKAYKLAQKAHRDVIAFMQQDAFYNLYAQEYEQASFLYQKVIKNLQGINRAKALLGYGYSLKKLHKCKQATKQFQKLLQLTPSLEHLPKNRYRLIDFEPKRLELLAYGFLVSCETDRKKQQSYLAKRVKILKDMKGNVSDFAYDEKTRLEFLIKTLQQEAVIYEKEKELNKMGKVMSEALQLLPLYIKEGGAYSSQVMLRTLDNYLALSILYPKAFHQEEKPLAKSLTTKTIQALTYPNYTPPLIKMEQKKLQKLLTKF
ncbi:hypothetical protein MNB_SM-3-188 [hydrothermal vent metagenome]|uniref:Uncharacterized protein n=1 Tax=hydrothermal vent metagenome TaxID=652676 RepID=A0A1W1D2Q4_9ZZZZ